APERARRSSHRRARSHRAALRPGAGRSRAGRRRSGAGAALVERRSRGRASLRPDHGHDATLRAPHRSSELVALVYREPTEARMLLCGSGSRAVLAVVVGEGEAPAPRETWAFAVSGDSRDCGDLVMPKIARAIADEKTPPIDFYWHLGDFRRLYDVDCDILKR